MNRRDAIGSLVTLAMTALPGNAEQLSWPDSTFTLSSGKTTQQPFGSITVYHEGPTGQLGYLISGSVLLNPGQEPHPPHRHQEEEFVLVTEGSGEIVVNGQTIPAPAGTLMFSESNHEHGIKNTGSTPLRFFYCKWSVRSPA